MGGQNNNRFLEKSFYGTDIDKNSTFSVLNNLFHICMKFSTFEHYKNLSFLISSNFINMMLS